MFLIFLVVSTSGAIICIALFSTVEIIGVPGLAAPVHTPSSLRRRVAGTGQGLVRAYVWFGWAASCAWFALVFGSEPGTPNPWVYYVTAIAASGVPVVYLHL